MATPTIQPDWSMIEDDPDFRALPPKRQREWREAWVDAMVRSRGPMKPKELRATQREYESIAFAGSPEEEWPSAIRRQYEPISPRKAFFDVSGWDVARRVPGALEKGFGIPQQFVTHAIKNIGGGERGAYAAVAPFHKTYQWVVGEREREPIGRGVPGVAAELATDPWMWATLGSGSLAFLLRGKSIPEIMEIGRRYPRLAPAIDWYLKRLTTRGAKAAGGQRLGEGRYATRPPMPTAERVGAELREVGAGIELTGEQQRIIDTISKNPQFKKILKPKELSEFADAYARATPEERQVLLKMLRDPVQVPNLITWLEPHAVRRMPILGPETLETVTAKLTKFFGGQPVGAIFTDEALASAGIRNVPDLVKRGILVQDPSGLFGLASKAAKAPKGAKGAAKVSKARRTPTRKPPTTAQKTAIEQVTQDFIGSLDEYLKTGGQ